MAKNKRPQKKKNYVQSNERKPVHRPEPPMADRRMKRQKTRSAQKRALMREYE